jgi:hypothetical protein
MLLLTAADGPTASGSKGHVQRRAACCSTQGRRAAPPLAPLAGTISQGVRTQSSREGTP